MQTQRKSPAGQWVQTKNLLALRQPCEKLHYRLTPVLDTEALISLSLADW